VKQEDEYTELNKIKDGVPLGSVLGPILYLLYTSDLAQPEEAIVATFADDIAIMAVGDGVEAAAEKLRCAVDKVNNWTRKLLIKLNEAKSVHVDFTNKKCLPIPTTINDEVIPHSNTAKYIGMTLDAKLCS
jgi:ABC-type dipeptide/oligopeptide/nickel transport system ATPase component